MATKKTKKTKKPSKSVYRVCLLDANGQPTSYTWDFPRVTTVLDSVVAKPRLVDWYYRKSIEGFVELRKKYGAKLPKDSESLRSLLYSEGLSPYSTKKRAAEVGRSMHTMLEALSRGDDVKPSDGTPEVALKRWWDQRGLRPEDVVAIEIPLVSFTYRYGGTVDLIYRDQQGNLVLTDLKSGNHIYWTHFLQGNAYKQAWEENGGEPIGQVSVVHVNMETVGGDGWEEVVSPEITFETFENVLKIYRELPTNWKPDDIPEEQEDG